MENKKIVDNFTNFLLEKKGEYSTIGTLQSLLEISMNYLPEDRLNFVLSVIDLLTDKYSKETSENTL